MPTKSQTHRVHIHLEKHEQEAARTLAKAKDTSIMRLFKALLEDYATGPIGPTPKAATPQKDMLETRVELDSKVYDKVQRRAKSEGRFVSDVIYDLVQAEQERVDAGPLAAVS